MRSEGVRSEGAAREQLECMQACKAYSEGAPAGEQLGALRTDRRRHEVWVWVFVN